MKTGCVKKSCASPQKFFNTTNCKCECNNVHHACETGRQIFNKDQCDCVCPIEKVLSQCKQENGVYNEKKCDCEPITIVRRVRNEGDAAPPPPPFFPPPQFDVCPLTPANCTGLKELNDIACECQCTQFLPLECPTPSRPSTHTHTHTHEYVYNENGCRELTPKGKRYRRVHRKRNRRTKKTSKKEKSPKRKTRKEKSPKEATIPPPPSIQTPASSCPDGQTPNIETCECMIP